MISIDVMKEQENVYVMNGDAKLGRRKELPRKKEAKVIVNSWLILLILILFFFPGVAEKEGGVGKQLTVIPDPEIPPVSDPNIISKAALTTDLW